MQAILNDKYFEVLCVAEFKGSPEKEIYLAGFMHEARHEVLRFAPTSGAKCVYVNGTIQSVILSSEGITEKWPALCDSLKAWADELCDGMGAKGIKMYIVPVTGTYKRKPWEELDATDLETGKEGAAIWPRMCWST